MKKVRERIIESASHLFSQKGFHAVSVSEITTRAKTNVSLVSFYFGGKNGLLTTLFASLVDSGMKDIKGLDSEPKTREEYQRDLTDFLNNLSDFYLKNTELLRIYMNELEIGNAEAEKFTQDSFGHLWSRLLKFLESAKSNGLITFTNSSALALQILAPFGNLMQNKNCSARIIDLTLENADFRKSLIEQVVQGSSVRLET